MRRLLLALLFTLGLTALASAHEGHAQKVMGTVAAIKGDQLEITTAAGKSSLIMLNEKTKIMKGKDAQTARDITVGRRVVIMVTDVKGQDGKIVCVARQISLGNTPATAGRT